MNDYEIEIKEKPYALINDKGFYFDEYIKNIDNKILYPTLEKLKELLPTLNETKKVIILREHQKQEITLTKNYLPIEKTPVSMNLIIKKFIKGAQRYDEEQILKLMNNEEDRYHWLTLYVFNKISTKYNLNPSYLYTNNELETIWYYYDLKQVTEKQTKNYIKNNTYFNEIIFLELMLSDLTKKETKQSNTINKILKYKSHEEIDLNKIKLEEELIQKLIQSGELYIPRKGIVARI